MNDRTCPSTLTCGSLIHPKHLATARCLLGVQPLPLLPTFITFLGNSSSSTHGQCTLSHSPTCAAAALLPWRHPCPLTRNPDQRNDHHHPCTQLTPASVSIHDSPPPFVTAIMQYTCRHREPWFSKVYASRCCSPVPLPRPWRRPSPEPRLPSVQPPRAAPPPAHAAVRPRPRARTAGTAAAADGPPGTPRPAGTDTHTVRVQHNRCRCFVTCGLLRCTQHIVRCSINTSLRC